MRWTPGNLYELEHVMHWSNMTVTAAGEVVVWVETCIHTETLEARWYDKQGKLIHTLPQSPQCNSYCKSNILAGSQYVTLACSDCQCIWLGSSSEKGWSVAWQATGKEGSDEREGQPRPGAMCQGKPGQIIAVNRQGDGESVSVFDITHIPFRLVVPEIKLGIRGKHLCYCELPEVGGALAVTQGNELFMLSLDSGALLWSVGGKDSVAGTEWWPKGVCTDNRGRLYVPDITYYSQRIIVLSAATGSVLQIVQGRGHWMVAADLTGGQDSQWVAGPGITVYGPGIRYKDDDPGKGVVSGSVLQEFKHHAMLRPDYLCWHEQTQSIIVGSRGKMSSFKIEF